MENQESDKLLAKLLRFSKVSGQTTKQAIHYEKRVRYFCENLEAFSLSSDLQLIENTPKQLYFCHNRYLARYLADKWNIRLSTPVMSPAMHSRQTLVPS